MKTFALFVFGLILLFACVKISPGCSFLGYPDPPLRYQITRTKTFFLGEVTKRNAFNKDIKGTEFLVQTITFKVVREFKGVDNETMEINLYERVQKSSCDFEQPQPQPREQWLVSVNYDEGDENKNKFSWYTTWVSRYEPEKDAKYLSEVETIIRNPFTAIYGQVHKNFTIDPVEGVTVTAEKIGSHLTVKTDKEGRYSFESVPPGKYKIRVYVKKRAFDMMKSNRENSALTLYDKKKKSYFFEYEIELKEGAVEYEYHLVHFLEEG
jgi:hypothetical protein